MHKGQFSIRRIKPYLFGLVTLITLSAILDHKSILLNLSQFLLVKEEKLQPADVIHVLGGRSERTLYALQLYQRGYGRKILFTGEEVASFLKRFTLRQGVPSDAVIQFESRADNTYQEALELRQLLEEEPTLRSVIVVSSPYHMRRVRWTFEQVLDDQITLQFAPVPFERSRDNRQWWTDRRSQKNVINEYIKLFIYWLKYRSG
ncbi:MAG: YdcF family protein [Nitrospira sp.]|nr:YdcF family protein [Nitrospira sp.]